MDPITLRVIEAFLLPPGLCIWLGLLGLLLVRRAFGRFLIFVSLLLLYLASVPAVSSLLAEGLETHKAVKPESLRAQGVQGLLVFMAGSHGEAGEYLDREEASRYSLDRISYAAWLHRRTGLPIILSGGAPGFEIEPLAEIGARALRERFGIQPLAVETRSANTWENAHFSVRTLAANNIDKVAIVTHAWHAPRSLYAAKRAGLNAIAAPTYFISPGGKGPKYTNWVPGSRALVDTRHLLHEYIGLWWYRNFR